jgi:hypothetical protein
MNAHNLMNAMNDTRLSINERISAATQLWELQSKMNKNLKSFKDELSEISRQEGEDLTIFSEDGRFMATVEKQPPTPKIETMDLDALRDDLGEELFKRYLALSYTIRWSEFRLAPDEVRERVLKSPGLEVTQTYQVKFKRTRK